MKLSLVTKQLIKPCNPTPPHLRNYHISLTDEISPDMNVGLVLYFAKLSDSHIEESLARILPHFYPLAGRYVKEERLVHCNDEGIEFVKVEASSDIKMVDMIDGAQQPHDDLLPRGSFTFETIRDPLLCIQVTKFVCGGAAIGISVTHRIFDASSLTTFIAHWANAHQSLLLPEGHKPQPPVSLPCFNSPLLFPQTTCHAAAVSVPDVPLPRFVAKRFRFSKEAIVSLRMRITELETDLGKSNVGAAASRVRLLCALIARALIRVDREFRHRGRSRACLIAQAVDLRGRAISPLLKRYSCGNLVVQAVTQRITAEDMGFQDLVGTLTDAIKRTLNDCTEIMHRHEILVNAMMRPLEALTNGDTNVLWFSDWSKFKFYEIDFGWGKPVWTSVGTLPSENLTILMDDKDGEGIEAWVHLEQEYMPYFEQDEEIRFLMSM